MIRLIEALNYRCLRYVRQELGHFNILVGPNASGKSTFLDVASFLGDLVSHGLQTALEERTENPCDLVWAGGGSEFQLALELEIPEERRTRRKGFVYDLIRYEVRMSVSGAADQASIQAEKVLLKSSAAQSREMVQRELFPQPRTPPPAIITPRNVRRTRTLVNKIPDGNDNFYGESEGGWDYAFKFKLGPRICALRNLPDDEAKFPAATWLKNTMMNKVQRLVLNSASMRRPSPPARRKDFLSDGSNLAWVVRSLQKDHPERFRDWIAHLRTALPNLDSLVTAEREEDRHCLLSLRYLNGMEAPSWMISDGALRLMALTSLSYIPDLTGVWLIEEPENGIHPKAIQTVFQSLSSVYGAQILLATHSPLILGQADLENVLCFAVTDDGAVDIVPGNRHPALRNWRGQENLGVLFAGGVLG